MNAEEYFDSHYEKKENGCWEWTGPFKRGYGNILIHSGKKVIFSCRAHRFSYEKFVGPLGDLDCLHKCDNRRCVNPDHLFKGTNKDNQTDCINKGRHPTAKLNTVQVTEIRELLKTGQPLKEIACRYEVAESTISMIKTHKIWI